jgi:hypothetical protein
VSPGDVATSCGRLATTQGALARGQAGDGLTNDDVSKMVRAQLSTNIILTTIRSANAKFDLSPSGLIALKDAGVSEQIIEAMLARGPSRESKVEKSERTTWLENTRCSAAQPMLLRITSPKRRSLGRATICAARRRTTMGRLIPGRRVDCEAR